MTRLEIVQEGLRLVRRELTPALGWVLEQEYGSDWWRKGVIDPLARTAQRVDELPREGDAGDIDLYLSLKLVQNYHFDAFVTHLGWDESCRKLVASVAACRNLYEGHVTANREAELTQVRAQEMLQDMSRLLLRLHEDHESDSIALMRPLAEKLASLPPDLGKGVSHFRPPQPVTPPPRRASRPQRSSSLNGEVVTVYGAVAPPPVTPKAYDPSIPHDLRGAKVSSQLRNDGPDIIRYESVPKRKPTDMAPIPRFLQDDEDTLPAAPRRRRRPRQEEEQDESVLRAQEETKPVPSVPKKEFPIPSPAVKVPEESSRAKHGENIGRSPQRKPSAARREVPAPSVPPQRVASQVRMQIPDDDPYAFVPRAVEDDFRSVVRYQAAHPEDEPPAPEPVFTRRSHVPRRAAPSEELRIHRSRAPRKEEPPVPVRASRRKDTSVDGWLIFRWVWAGVLSVGLAVGLMLLDRWITSFF